jgi:hypothetical protein
MKLATTVRNLAVDAIVDSLDAGAGAGTIKIYTGTQPANPQAALSGNTLLATLTFSDPAFGSGSSGVATANSITSDSSIDATGTATWARIADSDGTVRMDVTVGTSGSDINFNSVAFVTGGTCAITSMTVTVPES